MVIGAGRDGTVVVSWGLDSGAVRPALTFGAALGLTAELARDMLSMLADPEGPQGMRPHSGTGWTGSASAGGQIPGACACGFMGVPQTVPEGRAGCMKDGRPIPMPPRPIIPGMPPPISPPKPGIMAPMPPIPKGPASPIEPIAIGFSPMLAIIPAIDELLKRLLAWAAAAAADMLDDAPHDARLTPKDPAAAEEGMDVLRTSMLLRFCLLKSAGPAALFEGTFGAAWPLGRSAEGAGTNEADRGTTGPLAPGRVELAERHMPGMELRWVAGVGVGVICKPEASPPTDCEACMSMAMERGWMRGKDLTGRIVAG